MVTFFDGEPAWFYLKLTCHAQKLENSTLHMYRVLAEAPNVEISQRLRVEVDVVLVSDVFLC
jgi:hypothetical protein